MTMVRKKMCLYSLAFIVPVILLLIVYALIGQWPFGNKSLIVTWDMDDQYINFFQYLKSVFYDSNNFIYTFSKTLGGDMIGLTAYYLASPINLLFIIFNNSNISKVVLLVTLMKIGLSGFTFYWFISSKYSIALHNIIFSSAYALMGYNIVYQQNIMWLDGVILLPVVVLGLDKLVNERKYLLYTVSLAAAIITNYYIGYMICIFSGLYFIYAVILSYNKDESYADNSIVKQILYFIISSVLAVGLSSFILLPAVKSLAGEDGPKLSSLLDISSQLNIFDLISKFYTGSFTWQEVIDGMPNVFCSLTIVILVILYFINLNISKKEKICSAAFLAILFLSLKIIMINNIWHGFCAPTGFPYRFSFALTFLIIYFAFRCFTNIKQGIVKKHLIICLLLFLIMSDAIFAMNYDYLSASKILWSIFIALLTLICLFSLIKKDILKRIPILIMCILCFSDLIANGYLTLKKYNYADIYDVQSYINENEPILQMIDENDTDFYRTELNYYHTVNDSMLLNYNGLTHYSSCDKEFVRSFMAKLGVQDRWAYVIYGKGNTILLDSLFGIKYLLSKSIPNSYYTKTYTQNDVTVYKNPYALPIAFFSDQEILNLNTDSTNPFELQNNIFETIANLSQDILKPCDNITVNTYNLTVQIDDSSIVYTAINPSSEAYIEYSIKAENLYPMYANFNAISSTANLYIDDNLVKSCYRQDFDFVKGGIVQLGEHAVDDIVKVKIVLKDQKFTLSRASFYYQDMDTFRIYYDKITEDSCNLEEISSSHLIGTVNIQEDNKYLVFTIPYEDDWQVTLDGKKVETAMAVDTLMAIPISEGEHTVELKYIPNGLYFGVGISAFSLIAILIFAIWNRKNLGMRKHTEKDA